MKDYMLIIKIPFKGLDDLEARKQAKAVIENKNISPDEADIKLQEVFNDQPPRRVPL